MQLKSKKFHARSDFFLKQWKIAQKTPTIVPYDILTHLI